jgi:ribosomal protein S18 acetylase RimI-like enzyme
MKKIVIQPIQEEELPQALDVLGKAFAPMPNTIAIFGDNSGNERRMKIIFGAMIKHISGQVFVAKQDSQIIGAMRIVEWPDCQTSQLKGLKMMPAMMKTGGIGIMRRGLKLRGTWAKSDPKKPHWHLDPLGVTPELQGQGIGSQMIEYYCKHMLMGSEWQHITRRIRQRMSSFMSDSALKSSVRNRLQVSPTGICGVLRVVRANLRVLFRYPCVPTS